MEFPPFVDMEFPPFVLRLSKYERGERAEKSTLKPVIPASNRSLKPLAHSKVHPFLSKTWAKQH